MDVNNSVANGAKITVLAAPVSDAKIGSELIAPNADYSDYNGYIYEYRGGRWEIRIPLVAKGYYATGDIKVTVSPLATHQALPLEHGYSELSLVARRKAVCPAQQ